MGRNKCNWSVASPSLVADRLAANSAVSTVFEYRGSVYKFHLRLNGDAHDFRSDGIKSEIDKAVLTILRLVADRNALNSNYQTENLLLRCASSHWSTGKKINFRRYQHALTKHENVVNVDVILKRTAADGRPTPSSSSNRHAVDDVASPAAAAAAVKRQGYESNDGCADSDGDRPRRRTRSSSPSSSSAVCRQLVAEHDRAEERKLRKLSQPAADTVKQKSFLSHLKR